MLCCMCVLGLSEIDELDSKLQVIKLRRKYDQLIKYTVES